MNENKLWKDYYSVLKPTCVNCLQQGIKEDEYAFCSTDKESVTIYKTDNWGKKGKLKTTFNNNYKCLVYHWTIYQGQGKIMKT